MLFVFSFCPQQAVTCNQEVQSTETVWRLVLLAKTTEEEDTGPYPELLPWYLRSTTVTAFSALWSVVCRSEGTVFPFWQILHPNLLTIIYTHMSIFSARSSLLGTKLHASGLPSLHFKTNVLSLIATS